MPSVIVSPEEVKLLSGSPILLIDVRGHDEWRREHIPGARSVPLDTLIPGCFREEALHDTDTVVFHCQTGMRTDKFKEQLIGSVYPAKAFIMDGGLNA